MKCIAVSKFKAQALQIIDQVSRSRERIIIMKRGKMVAELGPVSGTKDEMVPGKLAHTCVEIRDIVTPFGAKEWEAAR